MVDDTAGPSHVPVDWEDGCGEGPGIVSMLCFEQSPYQVISGTSNDRDVLAQAVVASIDDTREREVVRVEAGSSFNKDQVLDSIV